MLFRMVVVLLVAFCSCTGKKNLPREQRLRLNLYCEPPTLDLRKATDSTSMNVLLNLFEGLTRMGPDHHPHPAIAEQIEVSEDGQQYTFHLRKTSWSNGDPLTAEDFLHSWQTNLTPDYPSLFAYKLYCIKNAAEIKEGTLPPSALGVEVPDPYTLTVTLEHPTPYFLELCAFPTFFPIHRKIDQKKSEWAAEAGPLFVSNGPFYLKKWEHESELTMRKNPHYWDASSVRLHAVHFAMVDDTTTEHYMYEMDELDWAGGPHSSLPTEILPALMKEGNLHTYTPAAVYYYKINTDSFPCQSVKFRQALGRAINRKAIVDHILQAEQKPAMGLIPPMPGWEETVPYFSDGDVAQAQELLAEALDELGMTVQEIPPLTITYNSNREHQKVAQAIQQQWQEVLGLRVELETFDWKLFLAKMSKQDYQIGRMGWVGDFYDPVSFLEPYKLRDNPRMGGNNETGWENAQYRTLLDLAAETVDPLLRGRVLREAEALLVEEMPVIPLYYVVSCYLKKPYVKNVYVSPLGMADYKGAYIER